ncbi:MAG: TolC family protein [Bacteroidetes bacterium]|nr:TolC family protein [Bacteroidota bacterium]
MNYNIILIMLLIISINTGNAQELLTKNDALDFALDHNYSIKIANNKAAIAKNNASILNNRFLPTVSANAGVNYSNTSTDNKSHTGVLSAIENAESNNYNSSIGIKYTVFDGFGRAYNYKKLRETHQISELDARAIIETTFISVFTKYFEIARLSQNENFIKQSLDISKQRLKRVSYSYDYGQTTKLEVLNAEVDVNNDSISYLNIKRQLANAKRDLNLLIGKDVLTNFKVETGVLFLTDLEKNKLLADAQANNVSLLKAESNIEIGKYDLKIANSAWLPLINFSSTYGLNTINNDINYQFLEQKSNNLAAGLSLAWNIFDGGATKIKNQNAKISIENLNIQREELVQELKRNMLNAWEVYQNNLFIVNAEQTNLATNERNFERSEELFKLGQLTSLQFRQAQVNLLNAQTNLNKATYDAKIAELVLLQLSGNLLNTNF